VQKVRRNFEIQTRSSYSMKYNTELRTGATSIVGSDWSLLILTQ